MQTNFMTNNGAYKAAAPIYPKGFIIHSTGANNPFVSRYVAPDNGIIGANKYNNHWNRAGVNTCVHVFIGKMQNGDVDAVQVLPYTYACWGCGKGKKGSYNYSPTGYLQLEVCEDALKDPIYFNKAFTCAAKVVAEAMKLYKFPIEDVVSHHEAYCRGYASNHADCDHWLKAFGKDMDWFRSLVLSAMSELGTGYTATVPEIMYVIVKKGDSLSKIAKAAGITLATIKNLNPEVKAPLYIIHAGDRIRIK